MSDTEAFPPKEGALTDVERYVKTIKDLKAKLQIAVDALEAIEICTNLAEAKINYQPLIPIVKHNHATVKAALLAIQGYTTEHIS